MISIIQAKDNDIHAIVSIGNIAVEEAHRDSCSKQDMKAFLDKNYNPTAIKQELADSKNIYNLIRYQGKAVGFSKIILNADHPNITLKNTAKLDRIYLLKEFQGLKLGYELMKFNIELSKEKNQHGIWLFTWVENTKAINFYLKMGFKIIGSHDFKVTETHYNQNHHMFLGLD